jgi:hypothetical protein
MVPKEGMQKVEMLVLLETHILKEKVELMDKSIQNQ